MGTITNYGIPVSKGSLQGYAQELTGWASYADDFYTESNPFVVAAGENLLLPNNASLILKD